MKTEEEIRVKINECESKYYYNKKRQYHRIDGPAIEYPDGRREWFFKGQGPLHPLEWLKLVGENKDEN